MKFSYDAEADALNIRLSNASFDDTIEVAPGVLIDVDEKGDVISIEMLDVSKRTQLEVDLPAIARNIPKAAPTSKATTIPRPVRALHKRERVKH